MHSTFRAERRTLSTASIDPSEKISEEEKRTRGGFLPFWNIAFVIVCEGATSWALGRCRLKVEPLCRSSPQKKQNGKRKILIPAEEIQEMMQPVAHEVSARLVKGSYSAVASSGLAEISPWRRTDRQ